MTTDLAFTVFRFGFLVLLWVMVFGVVSILRRDVFGTVLTPRGAGRAGRQGRGGRKKERGTGTSSGATKLLITGGPLTGTLIPLGSQIITIGRAPASTLVLEDPYSSSRHAELHPMDGGWVIVDTGSTNGTYVDDERLVEARPLALGVTARIGQTTFELVR